MWGNFSAEMIKLVKRPANWLLFAVAIVLGLLFTYVIPYAGYAAGTGGPTADRGLAALVPAQLVGNSIAGLPVFLGAIMVILGVLAVGGEYGWETWKTVLTQGPSRLAVYAGKLAALAVAALAVVVALFAVGTAASMLVAAVEDQPMALPPVGDLVVGLGAGWLIAAMWTAFGVLLAVLLRGVALALGLGLVWLLAVQNLLALLAAPLLDWVAQGQKGLPGPNAGALAAALRRWPVGALAVITTATTAYLVRGYAYGPILIVFMVAVYTVAVALPLRPAALAASAALVGLTLHVFVPPDGEPGLGGLATAAAWVVVPFAVGVTVRLSREAAARARTDAARRIADDERLRIAQEVHDVVGHGLAAINMQAEIALHLLHRKPEQAEAALTAISRTSKEGLDELRATLAAVRRGGDRAPTPGLAQLPALRDRLGHAGLPVTLSVVGVTAGGELPVAVDLAGYRIVQEALTNVLRHAGATTAQVRIEHRADAVEVEVTDSGLGGPPSPNGTGIAGMRERATALGGELQAGPRPDGGFRVHAVLPLPRETAP